jgi:uncharacterized protein (TIGR00369 family)
MIRMSTTNGFPISIPFVEDLGIHLVSAESGRSVIRLEAELRHLNSWGVVHGGVVMTLLDVAMASAGRSLRTDLGTGGNVTIEMKTSFLRPAPRSNRSPWRLSPHDRNHGFL